ncbi:MAG: nucleotidyltransferase family protein [Actinomycetota bacterium]
MAGVILAAGSSRRLGTPKQLLPLDGRPLLQHAVDAVHAAGVTPIVVVLGHASDDVRAALRLPPGARTVVNPDHAHGQSTSLRAAILHLEETGPPVDAVVVALGDQPRLRPDAVRALVAAHARGGARILQARYGGRPGHPVLITRDAFPDILAVTGDQGARAVIAADPGAVAGVEVGGDPPDDVDTPADYARLTGRD